GSSVWMRATSSSNARPRAAANFRYWSGLHFGDVMVPILPGLLHRAASATSSARTAMSRWRRCRGRSGWLLGTRRALDLPNEKGSRPFDLAFARHRVADMTQIRFSDKPQAIGAVTC